MSPYVTPFRSTAALAAGLLALSLAACNRPPDNRPVGQTTAPPPPATAPVVATPPPVGATVADKVDDATITASVNAGLAKDSELSAIKIDVDTKGGAVKLTGPAPSAAAKARAEEIAKSVKGVNSVDNQLTVKM